MGHPALTGAIIVLSAQQGEYQRTSSPIRGRLGQGLTAVAGAAGARGAVRKAARKAAKARLLKKGA